MIQNIRRYVNDLFADAPQTKKALDLKEEVCSNLIDKFVDLTGRGMPEEEAYNTAVASIGDIDELMALLRRDEHDDPKMRRRSALFVAGAVALYILSVIPLFAAESAGYDPVWGLIAMFALCAIATGMLIYNYMSLPKYRRMDDTMVEEFKEWKRQRSKTKGIYDALSAALWMTTVAVYFIISFLFGIWHISWVVFLIGAAVQHIIRAAIELNQ